MKLKPKNTSTQEGATNIPQKPASTQNKGRSFTISRHSSTKKGTSSKLKFAEMFAPYIKAIRALPKSYQIGLGVCCLCLICLTLYSALSSMFSARNTPQNFIQANFVQKTVQPTKKTLRATIQTGTGVFRVTALDDLDHNTDHIFAQYVSPCAKTREYWIEDVDRKMGVYVKSEGAWDYIRKPYLSATDDPRTDYVEIDNQTGKLTVDLDSFTLLEYTTENGEDVIHGVTNYANAVQMLGSLYQAVAMNEEFREYYNFLSRNGLDIQTDILIYYQQKKATKIVVSIDGLDVADTLRLYNLKEHKNLQVGAIEYVVDVTSYAENDIFVPISLGTGLRSSVEVSSIFIEIEDEYDKVPENKKINEPPVIAPEDTTKNTTEATTKKEQATLTQSDAPTEAAETQAETAPDVKVSPEINAGTASANTP